MVGGAQKVKVRRAYKTQPWFPLNSGSQVMLSAPYPSTSWTGGNVDGRSTSILVNASLSALLILCMDENESN